MAARAEVHDWRRELAAAEAERDRLAADKKLMLTKRSSSGSLYAGYGGGTPKARGANLARYSRSCPPRMSLPQKCNDMRTLHSASTLMQQPWMLAKIGTGSIFVHLHACASFLPADLHNKVHS